jgi:hypothetical protein
MERIETMPVKPLITTITGLALLVPASYFSLLITKRLVAGSSWRYDMMAPGFQEHAFEPAFHGSQLILYGPLLSMLINLLTIWRFRIRQTGNQWSIDVSYRRYWLNLAILLQASLLLLGMLSYLAVEHWRY